MSVFCVKVMKFNIEKITKLLDNFNSNLKQWLFNVFHWLDRSYIMLAKTGW